MFKYTFASKVAAAAFAHRVMIADYSIIVAHSRNNKKSHARSVRSVTPRKLFPTGNYIIINIDDQIILSPMVLHASEQMRAATSVVVKC